jgi:L-amino acid N-acyltransferase YncA
MQQGVSAVQDYSIRMATEEDREAVVDIFNYFVEKSFAAYPDTKAGYSLFDVLKTMCLQGTFYVIDKPEGGVIGFGMLRPHQKSSTFSRAAELTYFIMPGYSRRGLGARLLQVLEKDAAKLGVETLLANISSLNSQSLGFHRKQGFKQCGCFERVGRKLGRDFDVVWMQKFIRQAI